MIYLSERQKEIFGKIDDSAGISLWRDWKWQLRHQIRDIETFENLLGIEFEPEERRQLEQTVARFPIAITPYYLSLIDIDEMQNNPIFKQAFPMPEELDTCPSEMADPLSEDKDSPAPGITHRYPDRVLFLVSNVCSMYCRHCTRNAASGMCILFPTKRPFRPASTISATHRGCETCYSAAATR